MAAGRVRERDGGKLDRLADEELIDSARGGDARAFELLYQRHARAAYSLAYRMMGTPGAAEDVTQEAFLSAWRAGASYNRSRGSVRTWLLTIIHHRAVDALRRNAPHDRRRADSEHVLELVEAPQRTDDQAARADEAESLRASLESLPAEQRRVVELAYFGGFTQTEIADMLQMPVGTVKGRMRLALQKLRSAADDLEAGS